jgi:hypothetical protein
MLKGLGAEIQDALAADVIFLNGWAAQRHGPYWQGNLECYLIGKVIRPDGTLRIW